MKNLSCNIYLSYIVISILALGVTGSYAAISLKRFYLEQSGRQLETYARLVGRTLENEPAPSAAEVHRLCGIFGTELNARITVILPSGQIIGDSSTSPDNMDDHSDRPEIQTAFAERVGLFTRYSYTLSKEMIYVAVAVRRNGIVRNVVRASIPLTVVREKLNALYRKILFGCLLGMLLTATVSLPLSCRISVPLQEIDKGIFHFSRGELEHRIPPEGPKEIRYLADSLNRMSSRLDDRTHRLVKQLGMLESIFGSMVEAVVVLERDGLIIRCNQAAGRLFGFDVDAAENRDIQEVIRQANVQRFLQRTLESGQSTEAVLTVKPDTEKFLRARGTLLRTEIEGPAGVLLVFDDITRLKQLENMRRDFVANVSHELRTPITAISGFVETLQDGALDEPEHAARFLGIIARNVRRLYAIIEDLLSLSRIEQEEDAGQIDLAWKMIRPVLEDAVTVCGKSIQDKKIKLELVCEDTLRANINSELLGQAMLNLLDNAVKYSIPGGMVSISAARIKGKVVLTVTDNGCGIHSEHHARLFERFYRVDKARSCKLGGTGLGLAITKHIVQAHSGTISVDSAPGQGSIFSIRLPFFPDPQETA